MHVKSALKRIQSSALSFFRNFNTKNNIFTVTKTHLFLLHRSVTMISLCWISCYWVLPPRYVSSPLYESQPLVRIALNASGVLIRNGLYSFKRLQTFFMLRCSIFMHQDTWNKTFKNEIEPISLLLKSMKKIIVNIYNN